MPGPSPTVSLVPASALDRADLAAAFTAGYEGYPFPIQLDVVALERMLATLQVDLDASRAALDGNRPVGVALLAVRGREGWVGGMGVAADRRREGIGEALLRALLAAARERGLSRVRLEVLEGNEPARRLYERLGFRHLRLLDVWSLPAGAGADPASAGSLDEALARVASLRSAEEPWQRAAETVAGYRALDGETRAALAGDGGAVYRVAERRAFVLQLAASDEAARRALLAACLDGTEGGMWLNVPRDDPAAPLLRELGATVAAAQHELAVEPYVASRGRGERPRPPLDSPPCPSASAWSRRSPGRGRTR